MLENKNKFYLYDRWFYYLKEDENKITYTSLPSNPLNGIILQYNKENKTMNILYFNNKKLLTKINISDISQPQIEATYKEQEPQMIVINNNIYVNLLIGSYTKIDDNRNRETTVNISKKRNLNKLCYCEPTFPLNEDIDIKTININSGLFNYFTELVDAIRYKSRKLIKISEEVIDKKVEKTGLKVTELTIPDEIFFYDRYYQLDKTRPTQEEREYKPDDTIYYTNTEDGLYKLQIKYDPDFKFLTGLTFKIYDSQLKRDRYILELKEKENSEIKVSFFNTKKEQFSFKNHDVKNHDVKNALYRSDTIYDDALNITSNNIKVESATESYNLTYNPYFSNTYTDSDGNEYHVRNSTFSMLSGISLFSPKSYKQLIKTFTNN